MKILVTNDDGINSSALFYLKEGLEKEGHKVTIVAPKNNMSATSMAITLNKSIKVKKIEEGVYWVDGTPCDCVNYCLEVIMRDEKPDLVVSGINKGSNLGFEILYSGTVAAARLAKSKQINSIALSYDNKEPLDEELKMCAELSIDYIKDIFKNESKKETFVNLNFPKLTKNTYKNLDIKETILGNRDYHNTIVLETENEDGTMDYHYEGTMYESLENQKTDSYVVNHGNISITKMKIHDGF